MMLLLLPALGRLVGTGLAPPDDNTNGRGTARPMEMRAGEASPAQSRPKLAEQAPPLPIHQRLALEGWRGAVRQIDLEPVEDEPDEAVVAGQHDHLDQPFAAEVGVGAGVQVVGDLVLAVERADG